jgi:hypothetical protein
MNIECIHERERMDIEKEMGKRRKMQKRELIRPSNG